MPHILHRLSAVDT